MEIHPKCGSVQTGLFFHKILKWEYIDDFKESVIQADLMPLQLPFGFNANKRLNSDH